MSQTTVAGSFITLNTIDSDHYVDGSIDTAHLGNNQVDGAKLALASQAAGDVMYYNGTDWIRLAKGTADQVLTMNDGATAPNWETASAGATLSGSTNNTIVTVTGSDAMIGEANLTFTGTSLINTSANDAGDNVISVINTSNTTNDGAYVDIQSGGNAAGNAYVHFDANSEWSVGVDRVQQRFAISYNASGAKPGNTDILTIEQTGKISFAASSQEIAMSGNSITELAGVNFLASQSASANANTMDDYEEGTWTPLVQDHNLDARSQTYGNRYGRYQKVGNIVHISGKITMTSLGSLTTTSGTRIAGLPFTSSSTTNNEQGIVATYSEGLAMTANGSVTGKIYTNTTYAYMYEWDATIGTGGDGLTLAELSADGLLEFFGSYVI